jgi:tetratricopeptide (TPR) repeat protein
MREQITVSRKRQKDGLRTSGAQIVILTALVSAVYALSPSLDAAGRRMWAELRLFGKILHINPTVRLLMIAALCATSAALAREIFDILLGTIPRRPPHGWTYVLTLLKAAMLGGIAVYALQMMLTQADGLQNLNFSGVIVLASLAGYFSTQIFERVIPSTTDRELSEVDGLRQQRQMEQPPLGATQPTVPSTNEDLVRREHALRETYDKDPNNVDTAKKLITVLKDLKKYDEASTLYDALISADPGNDVLIREKAALYRETGDERSYVEVIRQADAIVEKRRFENNVGRQITLGKLEVRDLPFFDDFTWELQPRVNVLLGRNGYGKTHLLRALVSMLQSDQRVSTEFVERAGRQAMMRADISVDGEARTAVRTLLVFEKTFGKVPVLAIPDMRYIDKSQESIGPPRSPSDLRSEGALQFLRNESFESMILTFLYELCLGYSPGDRGFETPLFRIMENTVRELTRPEPIDGKMTSPESAESRFMFQSIVRKDNARFEILVSTEGNESVPLPLQRASQGTLSVLSMVGLTYRFLRVLYPQVPESEVTRQSAIVIIDEIDAHLHPAWQRKILQLCRDTFPKVQFIVTAHTPLVVAGCKEREVAVLVKGERGFTVDVIPGHFIGATVASMYQQIFQVEDKDLTYMRLNTRQGERDEIEQKVRELSKLKDAGKALSFDQQTILQDLQTDLYYLREAGEIRAKRQEMEKVESQRQKLELEAMNLRGEVNRLKSSLESQEQLSNTDQLSSLVEFLRELVDSQPDQSGVIEPFIRYLSRQGGHQQAASLLEALVKSQPKNVTYLKALAAQHQEMQNYTEAVAVLRRAAKLSPNDNSLRVAVSNLERIERESTEQ